VNAKYWKSEFNKFCPSTPIIVVATKTDLRIDVNADQSLLKAKEGKIIAKKLNAQGYYECSARFNSGLDSVFNAAIQLGVKSSESQK